MTVRPIDANALLQKIEDWDRQLRSFTHYTDRIALDVLCGVVDEIEDLDTLDYAPVRHGYWKHEEPVKDDGQKPFVCSTCGLRHPRYGDVDKAYFSYCPWCGTQMDAEMDGGKKDG